MKRCSRCGCEGIEHPRRPIGFQFNGGVCSRCRSILSILKTGAAENALGRPALNDDEKLDMINEVAGLSSKGVYFDC